MVNDAATPVYQTLPSTIKLSSRASDLLLVTGQHQLPEEPVRSKGQATLLPDGHAGLPTTIRDISLSGIGVIAPCSVSPGSHVHIDIHGHAAQGVVHRCQPEGAEFYIGITLDRPATPGTLTD
jgi:hypothetical protein